MGFFTRVTLSFPGPTRLGDHGQPARLRHNRDMSSLRISQVSSIEEMEAVSAFLCKVWAGGPEVVPFDLGLAVLHVGAYCSAAYEDDQMVAASFGFRGVFLFCAAAAPTAVSVLPFFRGGRLRRRFLRVPSPPALGAGVMG